MLNNLKQLFFRVLPPHHYNPGVFIIIFSPQIAKIKLVTDNSGQNNLRLQKIMGHRFSVTPVKLKQEPSWSGAQTSLTLEKQQLYSQVSCGEESPPFR